VIAVERRPWDIHTHSVQDLFHSIDVIRKSTGIDFQDVYNIMLRCGWTLGTAQLVPVMHAAIRLFHSAEVRILERHWAASRPDMVVSLIPHYNRAFKQGARPGVARNPAGYHPDRYCRLPTPLLDRAAGTVT